MTTQNPVLAKTELVAGVKRQNSDGCERETTIALLTS
jgi:hypothetical protein